MTFVALLDEMPKREPELRKQSTSTSFIAHHSCCLKSDLGHMPPHRGIRTVVPVGGTPVHIAAETPVREIAAKIPCAIPVLERLGVDYCCGGQYTLAEACAKRNIALQPALEELEQYQQQEGTPAETHWLHAPLKELTEYIIQKHHAYTRKQLALIDDLMEKVEERHGADHLELFRVGKAVAVFGAEIRHHTECEEAILFPYIAALGTGQSPELPAPANGSLTMPVARMMTDHDKTGDELRTLRALTKNFTPPTAACASWRGLYHAMEELEADLHRHIHLENNILFVRALEEGKSKVPDPAARG